MRTELRNAIKGGILKSSIPAQLCVETGYMILSFGALWASAIFNRFTAQFLVMSLILGLKWIFKNNSQIIRISYFQRGGDGYNVEDIN